MKIDYLKNHEIDKKRWDELIEKAPNGRIYAYSWYLDIVAKSWDALVCGDYEYIMPIPYDSKYGITYSMNPYFVQLLGIFSEREISEEIVRLFLRDIPARFKYVNLNINFLGTLSVKGVKFTRRTNYILDIDRSYEGIRSGYKPDARNKLKKENLFRLIETNDIQAVLEHYKKWNGYLTPYREKDYVRVGNLMIEAKRRGHLIVCQLLDDVDTVNASGFFLTSHDRAYHILSSQTEEGRKMGAKHFFIDAFIRNYCQKIKIFDFEGSNIPGVANFFRKWGSSPEYYTRVEFARFPVNLFK